AALSAREWQAQTANLSETFRAAAIPAMQAIVPIIRLVEEAGSDTKLMFMQLATAIVGMATAVVHQQIGLFSVANELLHGNFTAAVAAAKTTQESATEDWRKMNAQFS